MICLNVSWPCAKLYSLLEWESLKHGIYSTTVYFNHFFNSKSSILISNAQNSQTKIFGKMIAVENMFQQNLTYEIVKRHRERENQSLINLLSSQFSLPSFTHYCLICTIHQILILSPFLDVCPRTCVFGYTLLIRKADDYMPKKDFRSDTIPEYIKLCKTYKSFHIVMQGNRRKNFYK